MMNKLWVVEINIEERDKESPYLFHITTIEEMLEINRNMIKRDEAKAWIVVAVEDSYEKANEECEKWKKIRGVLEK